MYDSDEVDDAKSKISESGFDIGRIGRWLTAGSRGCWRFVISSAVKNVSSLGGGGGGRLGGAGDHGDSNGRSRGDTEEERLEGDVDPSLEPRELVDPLLEIEPYRLAIS